MSEKDRIAVREPGVLGRVAEGTRETLERAKEGVERAKDTVAAGASGVVEVTRTVVVETRERAARVAEFVRESETDVELRENVTTTAERALDRAGDAVSGAAPAIGRGAEAAAEKVGAALHAVARPIAVVIGAIAGTVGGWWKKASESVPQLAPADDEACRAHFTTVTIVPVGMTYDEARTGYLLGYVAGQNPDYHGRGFDDVELDLRQGFAGRADDYDSLREFTRYGYGRGSGSL